MDKKEKWFVNQLLELFAKFRKALRLSSTKRHILISIAYYANKNGEGWPSYQTIADDCGYSKPCVKKNIGELEIEGTLTTKERYKITGDRDSNYIKIHLQKIVDNYVEVGNVDTQVGNVDTQGWVTSIPRVGNVVTPNKLLELPKETTQEGVDFFLEETEETKEVEKFVNEVLGNGLFGEH